MNAPGDSGRPSDARRLLDEILSAFYQRGSLGGEKSHIRTDWVSVTEYDDWCKRRDALDAADAVSEPTPPRPLDRTEDGLIADAYQLIDWWLNARDEHVENHDALARKWIAWANDWLDVKSDAPAEPLTPPPSEISRLEHVIALAIGRIERHEPGAALTGLRAGLTDHDAPTEPLTPPRDEFRFGVEREKLEDDEAAEREPHD